MKWLLSILVGPVLLFAWLVELGRIQQHRMPPSPICVFGPMELVELDLAEPTWELPPRPPFDAEAAERAYLIEWIGGLEL
jgi:hypothetical protein